MPVCIEHLKEGPNRVAIDVPAEALSLPREEGSFTVPAHVDGVLTQTGTRLVLQAAISIDAALECSRCLTDFPVHISTEFAVLYERVDRFQPDAGVDAGESDDIEILDYDQKEIDISHRIREAILLALPMKPLCREECQGLCPVCGVDRNRYTCDCRVEQSDPRWEALRSVMQS